MLAGCITTLAAGVAMWSSPGPWTFGLDTGGVFLGQTVPAFRTWFAGGVPEWSDMLWGGFPLIGDCTSAALYPLHVIPYLATLTAPLWFFDVAFALHLGIFAAGSATLVRRLGASAGGTALAGLLAAFAPHAHYQAIVSFPVFGAMAWWPWALVAAEALSHRATPVFGGAMALGWVTLALQVLVGVPEQASHCAAAVTVWLLVRRGGLRLTERIVRIAVLGIGAAALAAPQLLPTMGVVEWTWRATAPANYQLGSMWLTRPVRLFVAGTGVLNGIPSFLGIATLVLAVVAAAARRSGALPLLGIGVVAFLLALGPQVGLYELFHRLPPFNNFRNPGKVYALAECATLWLAAIGADTLLRDKSRSARVAAMLCISGTLAERAIYCAQEVNILTVARTGDGLVPRRFARLEELTMLRRGPEGPPPVIYDAGGIFGGDYVRSFGALLGVSSIHAGTVALLSGDHLKLLSRASPSALSAFGVQYIVAPAAKCDGITRWARWPVHERGAEDCVLRNPTPSPRYELIAEARPVDARAMIELAREEPRPIPVVAPEPITRSLGRGFARVTSYAPGHVTLLTEASAPGLLLVRESFAPGWQVRVDGRLVDPYPAAGIFFVVAVPAGTSRVELDYRAPGLRVGALVAGGWVFVAMLGAWWWRRAHTPATRNLGWSREDELLGRKPTA
jgi:hypothetical protein